MINSENMTYAYAHNVTKAETALPIEILSSVLCYSLKSHCGATSWEVMASIPNISAFS